MWGTVEQEWATCDVDPGDPALQEASFPFFDEERRAEVSLRGRLRNQLSRLTPHQMSNIKLFIF
jgi:hypothetical protein